MKYGEMQEKKVEIVEISSFLPYSSDIPYYTKFLWMEKYNQKTWVKGITLYKLVLSSLNILYKMYDQVNESPF